LKETAKQLESTGAPSLSLRAVIRYAGGNWVFEPQTPGLAGAKEHGFLRAAWRDARQDFPSLEPTQVNSPGAPDRLGCWKTLHGGSLSSRPG